MFDVKEIAVECPYCKKRNGISAIMYKDASDGKHRRTQIPKFEEPRMCIGCKKYFRLFVIQKIIGVEVESGLFSTDNQRIC